MKRVVDRKIYVFKDDPSAMLSDDYDQACAIVLRRREVAGICRDNKFVFKDEIAAKLMSGDISPVPHTLRIPHAFSLQDKMPPVYNQASRGTCAANAAAALMEYYYGCKKRFSVQYLFERAKRDEVALYQKAAEEMLENGCISDRFARELAEFVKAELFRAVRVEAAQTGKPPRQVTKEMFAVELFNHAVERDGSYAEIMFRTLAEWGICTYDIWPYAREQLAHDKVITDFNMPPMPPNADKDAKRHRIVDDYYIFQTPNNVEELKSYIAGNSKRKPMPVWIGVPVLVGNNDKGEQCSLPERNGIVRLPAIRPVDDDPVFISSIVCKVEETVEYGAQNGERVEKIVSARILSKDESSMTPVTAFLSYDGVFNGGHAMLLVGYADDDAVPGGGYFIVRNSWGEEWGENGYGKIPYAYIELFAMSAATIIVPTDEDDAAPQERDNVPDDLKPYVKIADRDMKDRKGLWRIGAGDKIIMDANGLAEQYSEEAAALFRRQGFSWTGAEIKPAETTAPEATQSAAPTSAVPSEAPRFFSGIEAAFNNLPLAFPYLGGVKKPGIFGGREEAKSFDKAIDLTPQLGETLKVYNLRGKKTTFRIAALYLSDSDKAGEKVEKARQLVADYDRTQRFDPSACTVMVVGCNAEIAAAVQPIVSVNEARIVADGYEPRGGWRVHAADKKDDPNWNEWIVRLVPNQPAQWAARITEAFDAIDMLGGNVTLAKMAEQTGLTVELLVFVIGRFVPGLRITGEKVVKA